MAKPSLNPKIFEGQDIKTLKHDDYLLILTRDNPLLISYIEQTILDYVKRLNNQILIIDDNGHFINIIDYIPEKPIMRVNYYIGSIDLYIRISFATIDKEYYEKYRNDKMKFTQFAEFIFEFKPKIISFSEVMRQIKVYERLFDNGNNLYYLICLTEDNFESYKKLYNEQNIGIYNINTFKQLEVHG